MRNVPLGPMWSAVTDPDLNALLHPASVLGFLEELGFGRRLSSDRLRDRCVLGRTVLRPSDDSIPSLPTDAGARTAVSKRSPCPN